MGAGVLGRQFEQPGSPLGVHPLWGPPAPSGFTRGSSPAWWPTATPRSASAPKFWTGTKRPSRRFATGTTLQTRFSRPDVLCAVVDAKIVPAQTGARDRAAA